MPARRFHPTPPLPTNTWEEVGNVLPPLSSAPPGYEAGADLTASYPLPSSNFAVWDPTNGNDSTGTGSVAAPVKTLPVALSKITTGGTIVVRGGDHQGTAVGYRIPSAATYDPNAGYGGIDVSKACTIQPYPGEHPVFSGTRDESGGWSASGPNWTKNVVVTVDRGATDQYGKLDNDARGFGWLWTRNAAWHTLMVNAGYNATASQVYPLGSWNEQVWINDVLQDQVATLAEVGPGKYFVAGTSGGTNGVLFTSSSYTLGTDPTGKDVQIGELNTSLRMSQPGSTIQGIKFRRFIASNHMGGVIKAGAINCTHENILAEYAGCVSFELYQRADNAVYTTCEAQFPGNTGFKHAGSSYNLTYDRCKGQGANWRHYNWSPVSGGIKGVVGRGVTVKDCAFTDNFTKGVWWDVSNYDVKVINCNLNNNEENGVVMEISRGGIIANCTVVGSGTHGVLILDSHAVRLWNLTIVNSGRLKGNAFDANSPRHLKVYSDDRRVVDSPPGSPGTGTYPGYGRDSRQPVGDPTMNNWLIQAFEMKNCVLAPGTNQLQFAYLPIEDLQKNQSASRNWTDYGISSNGNLFNRAATNDPSWAFLLPGAVTAQTILTTLASWRTTTGQDAASVEVVGASVVDAGGWLTPTAAALYARGGSACPAVPLPADIAALIGKPVNDRHVGAYPA